MKTAEQLVRAVRKNTKNDGGIEAFLQQYDLSSDEGVLLMCIAEALLRIPDADTADRLIADKLTSARWQDHLGTSESLFVNASTWGLMLTGRLLQLDEATRDNPIHLLGKLANRAGEPVVRGRVRLTIPDDPGDPWIIDLELVDDVDLGRWCTADDVWSESPRAVDLAGVSGVRNLLPAVGGTRPESLAQARAYAPHAYRVQRRAVVAEDYARVAEEDPDVQRATAEHRWFGDDPRFQSRRGPQRRVQAPAEDHRAPRR